MPSPRIPARLAKTQLTELPATAEPYSTQIKMLSSNEPEPVDTAAGAMPSEAAQAKSQTFNGALLQDNDEGIVRTFQEAFEDEPTGEDLTELENVRSHQQAPLPDQQDAAIDHEVEDEGIDIAATMRIPPIPAATPDEVEEQRTPQTSDHIIAREQLDQALNEGTLYQKVAAAQALAPYQPALSINEQYQLNIARSLVKALQSNNDLDICLAYEILEYSPLRKHFLFTLEDQQRIREAQSTRWTIQYFQALLAHDYKNVHLLVDVYKKIHTSRNFLAPEDRHLMEVAQAYVSAHSAIPIPPSSQEHARVQAYDELFFSHQHFLFNPTESKGIEQERALLQIARPPLAQVNQTLIESTQFLALYQVKPLYVASQIDSYQKRLSAETSIIGKQRYQEYITFLRQQIAPASLPHTILSDLVKQALIAQALGTETEKNKRPLEKEIQRTADDFLRAIRDSLNKAANQFSLFAIDEQHYRNALSVYAQQHVFSQYLQQNAPGQTLEQWLNKRRRASTILYYQRPEAHAPTTRDQQGCWLFKWWFLRQPNQLQENFEESIVL